MVNSKSKGLTTELLCQAYLTSLGYNISIPLGEDCKYDLILDVKGKLIRIQVKSCNEGKSGVVFNTRSITTSGKENVVHRYTKDEIDYFAIYYSDQCYLIPVELCSGIQRTLSFVNKKVNGSNPLFIDDFKAEKIITNIINGTEQKEQSKGDFIVYQYDKDNNLLNTFSSYSEAGLSLGKQPAHISQCARGLRKTAYGYIWKISLKD